MPAPVTFETPAGPYEAPRRAVEWLWEVLDANELPGTSAALDRGLNGENVAIPPSEERQLCAALAAAAGRLQPGEQATAIADLHAHLCG